MRLKTTFLILAVFAGCLGRAGANERVRELISLPDADGAFQPLAAAADGKAAVLFFTSVECPRCVKYRQRLVDLHKTFDGKDVAFFAVYSHAYDSPQEIATQNGDFPLLFPSLFDPEQRAAVAFDVTVTPTVVLLDADRKVRYRGTVDDNATEALVGKHYLRDAIEAVLAAEAVAVAETPVVGCAIQHLATERSHHDVTYSGDVARILFDNCAVCHRPGQIGPFSLLTYEQARRWSDNIVAYTQSRSMPPWKPTNPDCFRGERRLTEEEIGLLARWVAAGSPLGDLAKMPAAPEFPEGWALGEPDLVLETPEYELEATGADEYRSFVLDPQLVENRDVVAVEYKPGNTRVVHHIISYIDGLGIAARYDGQDGKPGYASGGTGPRFLPLGDLGGWGPGGQPVAYPDDMGQIIPAGAKIVLEVHYHKSGKPEKDRGKVGLHFAKKPVKHQIRSHVVHNMHFEIPAGETRHPVQASWNVKEDILAVAIQPHMHLIGRDILATATLPDQTKVTLVEIQGWDFNWQEMYFFKQPLSLPKGTKIELTAWFDNSEDNANNPNKPPQPIHFGLATTDEMAVAYITYTPQLKE